METWLVPSCSALEFGREALAIATVCCHYALLVKVSCTFSWRISQGRMAKAAKDLETRESSGQMPSKYHVAINS